MRLAAEANVLLSAVLGGRAKLILTHPDVIEVLTTAETLEEVQEYAGALAKKKRLAEGLVLPAVASLPVTVVEREQAMSSIISLVVSMRWLRKPTRLAGHPV